MGKRVKEILKGAGDRLTIEQGAALLGVSGSEVWEVTKLADEERYLKVGEKITFVKNRNINITNICINSCGFCGYSRKKKSPDAYYLSEEEFSAKVRDAVAHDVTEICSVSGLHPDFSLDSYTHIYRLIHRIAPKLHIHASNPMEVAYASRQSGCETTEVLKEFKKAGLGSLCGTAAEILDDKVRGIICPDKIKTDEWARIIREAHALGIKSTATIMYGHVENDLDRMHHLALIRDIQEETRGFTEFVPLSFIHPESPLYKSGKARAGATGREDILMYAVSRLFLDNIPNLQASWVKLGVKMSSLALMAGANDIGGTMYEERISKSAGAQSTDYLDPKEMKRVANDCGRPLLQRTTLYELIRPV